MADKNDKIVITIYVVITTLVTILSLGYLVTIVNDNQYKSINTTKQCLLIIYPENKPEHHASKKISNNVVHIE